MDKINHIKKIFDFIKTTPLHPQWFAFKNQKANLFNIAHLLEGNILDIGCGQKLIEQYMSSSCRYIALDYFRTSVEWYGSNPEIYGDAQNLPFADESINGVLLLDVMEHLHGFIIKNEKYHGNLLESSGLLMNIAMSKTVLNWIH